jgi:hypothetical protein
MGSTELARTVVLLVVDADEMSRIKAGRSGCGAGEGAVSSTLAREACEAWVLVLGEGLDEVGVEWGMGDE